MLARISTDQPFDAHEDSSPTSLVLERVDPLGVLISLLYSHADSVAQKIQLSTAGSCARPNYQLTAKSTAAASRGLFHL